MMCTGVIPCLPSGLDVCLIFLALWLFGKFGFFENSGTNLAPKQSTRIF